MADFKLKVTAENATFDSSGKVTVRATVTNVGDQAASGEVSVVFVGPFDTNFDPDNLPTGFTRYVVDDTDPNIPQIVECRIPASDMGVGESVSFQPGLVLAADGPRLVGSYMVIATPLFGAGRDLKSMDARGQLRRESMTLPTPPAGANLVNLYVTYAKPVLKQGGTRMLSIAIGNRGPKVPMRDATLILVTPHLARVDRTALSTLPGIRFKHDSLDRPDIPDVLTATISRLLLLPAEDTILDPLGVTAYQIPLKGYGGLTPDRNGRAMIATNGTTDYDIDKSMAICSISAIQPA